MLKKIFSAFAKEEKPTLPEERLTPDFVAHCPEKNWITSQVFTHKNDKKQRFYFAARCGSDRDGSEMWCTFRYYWNVGDKYVLCTEPLFTRTVERAVTGVRNLEQVLGMKEGDPIAELKGNYRYIANLHGMHLDDDGNCVAFDRQKPAAIGATFSRKALDTLYAPDQQSIKSWDDFYRVVVARNPLPLVNETDKVPFWPQHTQSALIRTELYKTALRENINLKEHLACVGNRFNYFNRQKFPALYYHANVVLLRVLLHAGQKRYASMSQDLPPEQLETLSLISTAVRTLCCDNLDLTVKQATQVANLMMRGADPHAEKSLPFEEWHGRLCAQGDVSAGFDHSP